VAPAALAPDALGYCFDCFFFVPAGAGADRRMSGVAVANCSRSCFASAGVMVKPGAIGRFGLSERNHLAHSP